MSICFPTLVGKCVGSDGFVMYGSVGANRMIFHRLSVHAELSASTRTDSYRLGNIERVGSPKPYIQRNVTVDPEIVIL